MRFLTLRRDLVCREAVELVTDYLEGRMTRREPAASRRTCELATAARSTCDRSGRRSGSSASVQPEDLAPETRQGLMELYRQFRAD